MYKAIYHFTRKSGTRIKVYRLFLSSIFYSSLLFMVMDAFFLGFELSILGWALSIGGSIFVTLLFRKEMALAEKGIFKSIYHKVGNNLNLTSLVYFIFSFFVMKFFCLYSLHYFTNSKTQELLYITPSKSNLRFSCSYKVSIRDDPSVYFSVSSLCISKKKFNQYFGNGRIHILTNRVPLNVKSSLFGKEYLLK